jgi:hypothetical protein
VLHLLIGVDRDARALARASVAGPGGTRPVTFDPADDDALARLVAQVSAVPLFGDRLPAEVELAAGGDVAVLRALAELPHTSVVALERAPAAALLNELGERVRRHDCSPPSAGQQRARIRSRIRDSGVRFDPGAASIIEELARHDPERADSVLAQLLLLDRPPVSVAQVVRLSGTARPPVLPWELADVLLHPDPAGDTSMDARGRGVLAALVDGADPVAAWASVGRLLAQMQLVDDLSRSDGEPPARTLPGPSRQRLAAALHQIADPSTLLVEALASWVEADRRVKSDLQPPSELLAAFARLHALFAKARV